jgi:glycine oxidase
MSAHPDILIVGGGVIGLSTAWFLAGEGASVSLVEQGDVGRQASWAGAGIISPEFPQKAHSPIDLLRAHSYRLYPILSEQLRDLTGIDNGFVVCGGIEFPEEGKDSPLPTEEWCSEGIAFERLDRAGLLRRQPGLADHLVKGVWLPGMAQVRNPHHLQALRAGCLKRGVQIETGWPVRRLVFEGRKAVAVAGEQGRLRPAGQVLLAAGAWTEALLRDIGLAPGIHPVRGQIALLNTGRPGMRPLLLQGKRYLVPRLDGRILVGSTEEDAGFDARPTSEGIAGLLEFAHRLLPSLAEVPVEAKWAGLRPGSPDGLPFLGAAPGWERLHIAAGHFRAGLQLSPATGLVMAQHLLGKPTLVPLEPFRLDRQSNAAQSVMKS